MWALICERMRGNLWALLLYWTGDLIPPLELVVWVGVLGGHQLSEICSYYAFFSSTLPPSSRGNYCHYFKWKMGNNNRGSHLDPIHRHDSFTINSKPMCVAPPPPLSWISLLFACVFLTSYYYLYFYDYYDFIMIIIWPRLIRRQGATSIQTTP